MANRPCIASIDSIHVLNDDSLLHVFYLYRPFVLGEDQDDDNTRIWGGKWLWEDERWWYNLTHVCRRWRYVILGSASYLRLSLLCTYNTPVADMLAHSPPLPLVIDYSYDSQDFTAQDEEGAILALKKRDRVRRVRLYMPIIRLQKLILVMDEEYPILEYLIIRPQNKGNSLIFSETLQATHLRHLMLTGFALSIGSRLLTNAAGLVTLYLGMKHPSTYLYPDTLLRWISFMPQLETLAIVLDDVDSPDPNRVVERQLTQLTHTPIMTPFTLPNLRYYRFEGGSTYLEAIVHQITAPRLERLQISFFHQLTFSVPRLLQFMNAGENIRFQSTKFKFSKGRVALTVYPPGEGEIYVLAMDIYCCNLDKQVSSVTQISSLLSQMFAAVKHLTLEYSKHSRTSEELNEVDRTEWHKLLRPFRNVKTLRVGDGLVHELSRCLRLEDGELLLDLLPELQELTYFGSRNTGDAFTSFIDARQNAGCLVALVPS